MAKPIKFETGRKVITQGAFDAFGDGPFLYKCLVKHLCNDWGDLSAEDKKANNHAVRNGERILSAYNHPGGQKLWIVTESDRSATTFLLPEEY